MSECSASEYGNDEQTAIKVEITGIKKAFNPDTFCRLSVGRTEDAQSACITEHLPEKDRTVVPCSHRWVQLSKVAAVSVSIWQSSQLLWMCHLHC